MDCWVGFDIGGTKCAVCTGVEEAGAPRVLKRHEIATPATQAEAMERMTSRGMTLYRTDLQGNILIRVHGQGG